MDNPSGHQPRKELEPSHNKSAPPPPTLDPEEYREKLAVFELTKDQERELLQTLWNMMSMMVDLGWGLDSVQLFSLGEDESVDTDSSTALMKDNVCQFNSKADKARREN